jgi:hypothetical protein
MIFAIFTRQPIDGGKKQADYKQFTSVEEFVDWYQKQGDKLLFSLGYKKRILTESGWIKLDVPAANFMQAIDTKYKIVVDIKRVVRDDGILFDDVTHCSEELVSCIASKRVLKA